MIVCPECKGAGETTGMGCPGFRPVKIPCFLCKGEKQISEERLQWIATGEAMRQDRRKRGVSLREEAKRLGIGPSDLTDMEFGVKKPIPRAKD
jgi:hypothetical protein